MKINKVLAPWDYGPLKANARYLKNGDKSFFWLGDTAWLLFHKTKHTEALSYLKNRCDKGFNVIQATLAHQWPSTNVFGNNAFLSDDFSKTDVSIGGYWDYVDDVIQHAMELGLYMGLLPAWGSMVKTGKLNIQCAKDYATFLCEKYAKYPNIIWILGGDIRADINFDVWESMAEVFKRLTPEKIVAFHPFGRTSSSNWFANSKWLDINMFQSGHRRYDQINLNSWDENNENEEWFGEDNWRYVARDLKICPTKPTLDAEPSYEGIPQGLHNSSENYWEANDVRRYAYWSVFAGACGFTYGSNAVVQFYDGVNDCAYGAREPWWVAMHHQGSMQMKHLKLLMEDVNFEKGKASQDLLTDLNGERYERVSVFAGDDFILCYSYLGKGFSISLPFLSRAYWFDPIIGVYSYIGEYKKGVHSFTPAQKKESHNDWVLVIKRTF